MITTKKVFGSYVVEKVDIDRLASASSTQPCDELLSHQKCAIPDEWCELKLLAIKPYNHDTSILRFSLPDGCTRLNLPIGGFILVLAPGCEHGGGDAIRPYTSTQDDELNSTTGTGTFELLCKRYDQWGVKESITTHFLFTKTDHSYRPPGAVSNYLHKLKVGDCAKFKHTAMCRGKIPFPFLGVRSLTMIAVGVGIAPMIQVLRGIFKSRDHYESVTRRNGRDRGDGSEGSGCDGSAAHSTAEQNEEVVEVEVIAGASAVGADKHTMETNLPAAAEVPARPAVRCGVEKIVLLYGARTVADILLREQLDAWAERYGPEVFQVVYCVGSRWDNVHWGAKTKGREYAPPPPPEGFSQLKMAELGWVSEEKVRKYGCAPAQDTRVLVCGLPGVYDKLCGGRDSAAVAPHSVLHKLGYTEEHVIKL